MTKAQPIRTPSAIYFFREGLKYTHLASGVVGGPPPPVCQFVAVLPEVLLSGGAARQCLPEVARKGCFF